MTGVATSLLERTTVAREDLRAERVLIALRFGAAAAIVVFGRILPNIGLVFVVVLAVFLAGYGALIARSWAQVRTQADRDQTARFALAADISLMGFALLVFAPDPGWTVYICGFLVITSGGFRVSNGALLSAASLSLAYVVVMIWRAVELGIVIRPGEAIVQLGGYVLAGVLLNAVLPELAALRELEHGVYEPILEAEENAGDAVLMTNAGRPIYWNHAFERLTGYGAAELTKVSAIAELLTFHGHASVSDALSKTHRASLSTKTGNKAEVEVVARDPREGETDRQVWILRDVTAREHAEAELRARALHDELTGLPNRTLLGDRLESTIAIAQRQFTALSVLLLDLDGFKQVNDTHGHEAGDIVLKEVAARLSGALRESDTAARLGGDEFVLLLPATPLVGATEAARALSDLIKRPIAIKEATCSVGASIGIAVFPEQGRDARKLLAAADAAMYEAKRSGGGYRVFAGASA